MKLFGWGKSKDIQPQPILQQVKNPDPRNSLHGLDRGTSFGARMPCKGSRTGIRNKQQGLFGVDDDGYLHGAIPKHKVCSGQDAPVCDEKLQDTIRFVFSHEQEGLLAIGTFALEQLAAVRNAIEEHQKEAAAAGHEQDGFESCTGMMQSSDDEDTLPRSWPANSLKNICELPAYGSVDVYSTGLESEAERGLDEGPRAWKEVNQSKALTLYKAKGNRTPIAGVKPIVLLTALPPELRKVFDPAKLLYGKSQLPTSFVPHWTDSVSPPVLATADGPCDDDESYYSSRFCGLFSSKKKRLTSYSKGLSKTGAVHIVRGGPKKLSTKVTDQRDGPPCLGSNGMPYLEKLAQIWKSSCKQSSSRIVPKSCSPRPSQEFEGPPCAANGIESGEVLTAPAPQPQSTSPPRRLPTNACSPKVAEFRRRVAMRERNNAHVNEIPGEVIRDDVGLNRDNSGHWVKTDSEFVVLEM